MEKEIYRLLGKVNIPENKKAELNRYVQEVLYKGGIRKSCDVVLDGKTFTVLKPAVPDENGMIRFDYSVFERKVRQVGFYDTNTCTLTVSDRGYNEYGLVVNLTMFLLEIYSEDMCLLMEEDVPIAYPKGYLRLLKGMLGVEFFNDKRYRMWDMVYLLYQNGIRDIEAKSMLECSEFSFEVYREQTDAYMETWILGDYAEKDCGYIPKEELGSLKSAERRRYLRRILSDKLAVQDEAFEKELKVLVISNLTERQKMAERDDTIGFVAMCSLYMLPAVIVGIYAGIKKIPFWEAWEIFGNRQYSDFLITEKGKKEEEELVIIPFYQQICRTNENEFLEHWDGANLILSDKMKDYIELWQNWYGEAQDITEISMEKTLAWIAEAVLVQREEAYLDYDFVMEFLEHKDDINYQKAISLFRKTKEKDCVLFPELTVKQSQEEVIKYYQCEEDKMALRMYQALLHNRELRNRLFGF